MPEKGGAILVDTVCRVRLVDIELHNLRLQGLSVQQDELPRSVKTRKCHQSYLLSVRSVDDRGIELWLVAHEQHMWTLFDHEGVTILKWIAP